MEELNLKARRVLETIYNNGGEATTAEIKESTGLKNPQITKYHAKDVLADRGFTTYTKIQTDEHPSGVLKFELTEKGEDRIAHLFEDGEDIPIKDRMEDVEDRFHEVENTVSSLYGDVEYAKNVADDSDVKSKKALSESTELREEVEDLDEELGLLKGHVEHTIDKKIENLERRLEKVEDTLSDLRGLDHRVADIETKIDRLDIPEPEIPEEVEEDHGEEVEEDHGEDSSPKLHEKEDLSDEQKVAQVTRYFDEKSRDNRHWSRSHAKKRFDEKFGYRDRIYRKAIKKTKMKL
jgi:chromosome segregation ATPase